MTQPSPTSTCSRAVIDAEGIEGPCDRIATGWAFDDEHASLYPACFYHASAGGAYVRELLDRIGDGTLDSAKRRPVRHTDSRGRLWVEVAPGSVTRCDSETPNDTSGLSVPFALAESHFGPLCPATS